MQRTLNHIAVFHENKNDPRAEYDEKAKATQQGLIGYIAFNTPFLHNDRDEATLDTPLRITP